jgi:hypothetical protein
MLIKYLLFSGINYFNILQTALQKPITQGYIEQFSGFR